MKMKLYLDYMIGKSEWQRCAEEEIKKYVTRKEFYVTWQRYCNERVGEFGEIYGNWPFDFDHEMNIAIAQKDCVKVYGILVKKGVNTENIRIYFSGNKGFHLEIDYRSYMDKPAFDLHLIYREFYKYLERLIKPERNKSTMDSSIYSIRKMWRYPNTQHQKSGLYCVPITYDELRLPCAQIFEMAKGPRNIPYKYVVDPAMKKIYADARTAYWKTIDDFEKRESLVQSYTGGYPPCIKKIFEEGLPSGTINNTIYLLARFLKKFKKEEEVCDQLLDLAQKSYGNSSETNQVRSTVRSAFKRDGSFLSCASLSTWCEKEQCNIFSQKGTHDHIARVDKAFNIYTYQQSVDLLKTAIKNGEYARALKTGIAQLDRKTKVLQDSVIVIGALSDVGKTSFAITIAKNNKDKRILYLAIEEGRDRAALRLLRSETKESANISIVTGQLGTITPDDVYSLAYTHSGKFDFMILDQLINLTEAAKEERLKYKHMMEKFREIAREFKNPIFVLHQLNRLVIREKEPSKEHLAEGADIERQAYDIWLLYRMKHEGKTYNFIKIDKNKNYKSPIIIPLEYDFKTNTFNDYPSEDIDWDIFEKFNVDQNEYLYGEVEEDIEITRQRD